MTCCPSVQKCSARCKEGKARQRPSGQTPDEQCPTEDARNQSLRVPDISRNAILLARVLMALSPSASRVFFCSEIAAILHHPLVESAIDYQSIKYSSGGYLEEPLVRIFQDGGGKVMEPKGLFEGDDVAYSLRRGGNKRKAP